MRTLRVALAQLRPHQASPDKNVERAARALGEARKEDANLVVFPELFLTGYWAKDMLYRLAEPITGPHVSELLRACSEHGLSAIVGFVELDETYLHVYNSALLLSPDGEVAAYRKRHLPTFLVFDEARWFKAGHGPYSLWRVAGVPVGVEICYDVFFPEVTRAYALLGAWLVVAISASPDPSLRFFKLLTRARALENTVFFTWVNLVGVFDGLGFPGGSQVVSPLGDVVLECKTFQEELRVVELDMGLVRRAREVRPVIRDLTAWDVAGLYDSYFRYVGLAPPASWPRLERGRGTVT